jgi:uncharacterized membrane protein YebE (DUF533 family)
MDLHKTFPEGTSTCRRDPMRWKVAALVALALLGIGAMHTHVLMFRGGKDLLDALVETGGMILIAAIPLGYLVYRNWFTEHPIGLNATYDDFTIDEGGNEEYESGYVCGYSGCGLYSNGVRID